MEPCEGKGSRSRESGVSLFSKQLSSIITWKSLDEHRGTTITSSRVVCPRDLRARSEQGLRVSSYYFSSINFIHLGKVYSLVKICEIPGWTRDGKLCPHILIPFVHQGTLSAFGGQLETIDMPRMPSDWDFVPQVPRCRQRTR